MAKQDIDLLKSWQKLIQKWELDINDWSENLTEKDRFSAMMSQATKMNLAAQKAFAKQMGGALSTFNVPTRDQIDELGERLDRIDDNIEQLRLAVERLARSEQTSPRPEPKRTRKPPQRKDK